MVKRLYTPSDARMPTELAAIKSSLQDVQRPTGTERERSLLQLQEALEKLEAQQLQLQQQQEQLETVVEGLATIVNAIPVTYVGATANAGFGVTTSWASIASVNIPTPAGRPNGSALVVGGARIPWSSDGSKWPVLAARAVVDGVAGPASQLSGSITDSGSGLSGVAVGSFQMSLARSGTAPVVVEIQVAITGWLVNTAGGPLSTSGTEANASASVTFAQ